MAAFEVTTEGIKDGDRTRIINHLKQLKIKVSEMTINKYSISFEAKSGS
jgi:hypothetical protein